MMTITWCGPPALAIFLVTGTGAPNITRHSNQQFCVTESLAATLLNKTLPEAQRTQGIDSFT